MGNGNSNPKEDDPVASIFGKCSTLSNLLDQETKQHHVCQLPSQIHQQKSANEKTNTQEYIENRIFYTSTPNNEEELKDYNRENSRKYSLSHDYEFLIPTLSDSKSKSDPTFRNNSPPKRMISCLSSSQIASVQTKQSCHIPNIDKHTTEKIQSSPYSYMLYQKEAIETTMQKRLIESRSFNQLPRDDEKCLLSEEKESKQLASTSRDVSSHENRTKISNCIRIQRRAEHNQAIVSDLCDIVADMFLAESKLIRTMNNGYAYNGIEDVGNDIDHIYSLVRKFIEGLPIRYALGVETPSEVLLHMRLVAVSRSEKNKAAVHLTNNLVTISCSDRPGLLEYITKLLHANGSRVIDADVMTTADNIVLDRFLVQMNGRLRIDKLQQYIEKYLRSSKMEISQNPYGSPISSVGPSLYFQPPCQLKKETPLRNAIPLKALTERKRSASLNGKTSMKLLADSFTPLPSSSYDQQTSGQNAKECACDSALNTPPSAIKSLKRREPINREAHHFDDNLTMAEQKGEKNKSKRGILSSILFDQNRPKMSIPLDEIMLLDTLETGNGRGNSIYKAAWKNKTIALKVATSSSSVEELKREADISSLLKHPNVSQFLGICEDEETFCLAHEFCHGGSLQALLSDTSKCYEYLPIALDICSGMAYLHSRNVIHRDLKPSNILLSRDDRAKIADFGISITHTGREELTAETGTYRWMAPEVIRHESYSSNADVYSFGIVLWQLITREVVPFANLSPIQTAYAVAQGHRPKIPPNVPTKLKQIIELCWKEDAQKRPSFTYIAMALADYAQMAFHPSNVGAQTVRIANEMLANIEGNSTVNVDFTTSVFPTNVHMNNNCGNKVHHLCTASPVSGSYSSTIGLEI